LSDAQFDGQGRRESAGKPPQDCQDNGKNHSRQLTNCTTAAAISVSGYIQPANKWQAPQWIRFNHPACPPDTPQNPLDELEYFTLDLSRLFFYFSEGWDKQQVPHTNVSWLISFSFVHLMWMWMRLMMMMMVMVVVVVMPLPKPLVWRQ